ncbi:type II toxin-antitoxin system RelE/ParE family toxin [Singulisphaera sp. Ch08]|uniref:type II toxin-antitoxin system RelE/ParE family toxin n=1 Tax=Singulisphaera sp. Ch08 TaxID=3120278 RepID=UPI0038736856
MHIRQQNPLAALRFLDAAEATIRQLAASPGLGARYAPEHPALAELRFIPIARFKNDLVYYLPLADGIEVLRVLRRPGYSPYPGGRFRCLRCGGRAVGTSMGPSGRFGCGFALARTLGRLSKTSGLESVSEGQAELGNEGHLGATGSVLGTRVPQAKAFPHGFRVRNRMAPGRSSKTPVGFAFWDRLLLRLGAWLPVPCTSCATR